MISQLLNNLTSFMLQVLRKLLAKGLANKTIHDIMHAGAWRGEAFLYIGGELDLYLNNLCLSTKLKLHIDTEMSLLIAELMLSTIQVNNKNKIMQ